MEVESDLLGPELLQIRLENLSFSMDWNQLQLV